MMAANELNAHSFLQSKSLPANLLLLVGGFETQLGEQVRLTICGTVVC
jgi:hypothetical protein